MAHNDRVAVALPYHLEPGYIYGSRERTIIRTILGSCVAITLWDSATHTGAMCHYIFPVPPNGTESTSRFGITAFRALISIMADYGCIKGDLIAQVYGGARPSFDSISTVGSDNIRIAQKLLTNEGIPFASQDIGGVMGRKILFDTWSGETVVAKVNSLRKDDWL